MVAIQVLAAVNAAMKLTKSLLPEIDAMFRRGEISLEQLNETNAEYQSLKRMDAGQFEGAHWQIDPDPPAAENPPPPPEGGG